MFTNGAVTTFSYTIKKIATFVLNKLKTTPKLKFKFTMMIDDY